jgi:hypothetical protein
MLALMMVWVVNAIHSHLDTVVLYSEIVCKKCGICLDIPDW